MNADQEYADATEYECGELCDLIHAETARTLATYRGDFYAGRPALTVNDFGAGKAYYIASRNEDRFLDDFYRQLITQLAIPVALPSEPPRGVSAQVRTDGEKDFVFLLNFTRESQKVELGNAPFRDLLTGDEATDKITLPARGCAILERRRTRLT